MIRGERVVHLTPTSFLTRKWGERFAREWLTVHLGGQNLFLVAQPLVHVIPEIALLHANRDISFAKKKLFSALSSVSYNVKSPRFDQSIWIRKN